MKHEKRGTSIYISDVSLAGSFAFKLPSKAVLEKIECASKKTTEVADVLQACYLFSSCLRSSISCSDDFGVAGRQPIHVGRKLQGGFYPSSA